VACRSVDLSNRGVYIPFAMKSMVMTIAVAI
jgi:hypothetical protein